MMLICGLGRGRWSWLFTGDEGRLNFIIRGVCWFFRVVSFSVARTILDSGRSRGDLFSCWAQRWLFGVILMRCSVAFFLVVLYDF